MLRRKNDILWKGILEGVFDDLLRFLFKDAEKVFDLQRGFEFLDKELAEMYPEPDKKSATRFVDKLVKGYLLDGSEEWVLVHVEVQGTNDPGFAERMFGYYCSIYERYKRPITGIAIFTGKDARNIPACFERTFLGSCLCYRYNAIYVNALSDDELMKDKNPFALVLLAAKMALGEGKMIDEHILEQKRLIVRLLYERSVAKSKIRDILIFLHNYVRFENPENSRIFKEEIESVPKKVKSMGIVEQVAEMMAQEMAQGIAQEMAQGMAQEMAQGIAQGMAQGMAEGLAEGLAEEKLQQKLEIKLQEKAENERRQFVRNLLINTRMSVEKIAMIANVTKAVVNSEKRKLKK